MTAPPAPRKPLSAIFDAFAQETEESFRRARGRFMIVDLADHSTHGQPSRWKTGLSGKKLQEYAATKFQAQESRGQASAYALHDGAHGLNVILFDKGVYDTHTPADIEHMLDHELGHLLVKGAHDGRGPDADKECLADVFMLIRHYQRHGADAPFEDAQSSPFARADTFLRTLYSDHLTSFATMALMAQKDSINFNTLSPRQTLKLARRIVAGNQPPPEQIRFLKEAFVDTAIAFQRRPEEGVRSLVELTLRQPADNPVFKLGSLLLGEYLKGVVPGTATPIGLPADYFTTARRNLEARIKLFAQNPAPEGPAP